MPLKNTKRLPADAGKLINMALALLSSGSRIEDHFWERHIDALLIKNLRNGNQPTLEAVLTCAQDNYPEIYDMLADLIETHSESFTWVDPKQPDVRWDALLVAVPILVWTRYSLPSGPLSKEAVKKLQNMLEDCIFATTARVGLAPNLYSIDQLPEQYVDTWRLAQQMSKATLLGTAMPAIPKVPEQTASALADSRFLVAMVMAPTGEALFRWQEEPHTGLTARQASLAAWIEQNSDILPTLLPGCEWECLLPDALHSACREADEHIRPHMLSTVVRYLTEALELQPSAFRAVIAPFGEKQVTEYRISFTLRGLNDVLYGMVWPLYEREEDHLSRSQDSENEALHPADEIAALLKKNGVTDIRRYPDCLEPQYCDDCASPLYVDPHGDIVHAEMPEDANVAQPQLH